MRRETVGRLMEVLLVEDSLMAARLTMGALKRGHIEHRMTWISDGAEALSFLRQEGRFSRAPRPDLVLLDLGLPSLDGRELLAAMRADPELQDIPVVVMTGEATSVHDSMLDSLDVQGFMVKPVNMEKFLALVEQLKGHWKADMILPQRLDLQRQ